MCEIICIFAYQIIKDRAMNIKEYRLTSSEEPTDEMLDELMAQVAASARESTAKANDVLRNMMLDTITAIREQKAASSSPFA